MTWAHLKLRFSNFSNLLIIRKMLILFVWYETGWIIFVAGFLCFDTFSCSSSFIRSSNSSITFNDNGIFRHWKLRLPLNWKSIECLGHLRFSFFNCIWFLLYGIRQLLLHRQFNQLLSFQFVLCRVCVCVFCVYVCYLNAWMRAHVNLLFVSYFDVQTNTQSVTVLHRLLLVGWLHLHHNKQLLLFTSPSSHCRIPNEFNVKPSWFGILILVSQLSQFIPFFGFVHSFCLRIYIMWSCFGLQ